MIPKVSDEELRRLSELRTGGIPLDEEVLRAMTDACRGLSLYPSPAEYETSVFDLPAGGTGYMLGIVIFNESDRIILPQQYILEIPWHEPEFRWLEKPWTKVPRESEYLFPSHGLAGFDPQDVLNHRLGSTGKLFPGGDPLDGLLLGVGREPIPEQYLDRQAVWMRLLVFDQRARRYELKVKVGVSREKRRSRRAEESFRGVAQTQKVIAGKH